MTDLKIIATDYQDPLLKQLREQVEGCSDNFPVLMLPVRLETRFKKATRYINVVNPNETKISDLLDGLRRLIYKLHLVNKSKQPPGEAETRKILEEIKEAFSGIRPLLNAAKEAGPVDRQIIRETLSDLRDELNTPLFKKYESNRQILADILNGINRIIKSLSTVPGPAESPDRPGWRALDELQKLGDEMLKIYGKDQIPAGKLDETLSKIESCMARFREIMDEPGFLASEITIRAIETKISFIKRSQKNSPVRLSDFRKAYSGKTDLVSREYRLRNEINDLKSRIDNDYVPYMELLGKLKQYPVRQLTFLVERATLLIRAGNDEGYASADSLLKERKDLYGYLRKIRESAHLPLQGSFRDINVLKTAYDRLEKEIMRLIDWSQKVKPITKAHKTGLSRLRTHLNREYLEDLKQLRSGEKSNESQIISNEKVRSTAIAYKNTLSTIRQAKEFMQKISQPAEKAVLLASTRLEELKQDLVKTSSNTILLPRAKFNEIRGAFQGLSAEVGNFYNKNSISKDLILGDNINTHLESMKDAINDQHTDIFDEHDKYYDEFRKRITFVVRSETVDELWVRIYPDDIAIDSHDERLTAGELQAGKDYYNEIYKLPEAERRDAMLPAWRAAAASLGARRAAFVVNILKPAEVVNNKVTNPSNRIKKLVEALQSAYKTKRILWPPDVEEKLANSIKNLPAFLQATLTERNFTPCIRTRPFLDRLLQILNDALSWYENEIKETGFHKLQDYLNEQQSLILAREFTLQYYSKNISALGEPFDPKLSFPEVSMRSRDWDRAGLTSVMPDRFVVVTKREGKFRQIKVGDVIPPSLMVSLDPDTDNPDDFCHTPDGDLHVPENLNWMFDFDAAVKVGMAVRIPLTQEDFEKGFDFVMAYGVRSHSNAPVAERHDEGQKLLNGLLENHLYSHGGLEFLPVGTATNNTDEVKSPFKTLDDDYDGIFNLFINPPVEPTNSDYTTNNETAFTDGRYFRDALGIPLDIAAYIRNHDKTDIANSRAMSRALYGATLGYYMRFMLRNIFNDNDMDQTLFFMRSHVSAVGNLPVFRINKQPYGVLPITLHNKVWVDEPTTKGTLGSYVHKLSMFLSATRQVFENDMLKKVATINTSSYDKDPQKVFLGILGLEPYSKQFVFREGANVAGRWGDIDDLTLADIINWSENNAVNPAKFSEHYSYLLSKLGLSSNASKMKAVLKSRAYGARYVNSNDILGFLVQDPELAMNGKLPVILNNLNYIQLLNNLDPVSLFSIGKDIPAGGNYNTLLFELLRISLMYDDSDFAHAAVEKISNLDVRELERLMAGHLDLCSYRIDAWQAGLADYRLRDLRKTKPTGIFLGAYGFVENLKQAPPKSRVQHFPEGLEPADGSEVAVMPDNQGFIHGPSLNHAVTAAVLRAGYNSQKKNENNTNNIFGINLNSSRIRKALHLLEGVAGGQESGALLGYQFERALHEKYLGLNLEMDKYIYLLRHRFPLVRDLQTDSGQQEDLRALNVVDGLALIDFVTEHVKNMPGWDDDKTFAEMMISQNGTGLVFPGYPWDFSNEIPDIDDSDLDPATAESNKLKLRAIIHEIDNMADSFDAMCDLITAEGVYQLVRGNHTRAGAVLSAMSEGRVPSDPEIIRCMREGNMVSHRVLMALDPVGLPNPWDLLPSSPRSETEPGLNRWLAEQLGDPQNINWRINFGNTITYISLADLKLQPIDLVLLIANGDEGLAELELRTAAAASEKGASPADRIYIDFNSCTADAKASLGEYLSLISQLGIIVTRSRIADTRDFRIAESEECFGKQAPGLDTEEILTRLKASVLAFNDFLNSLSGFARGNEVAPSPALVSFAVQKSIALTAWGFNGYYPDIQKKGDERDVVARVIDAKEKIMANIIKINQLLDVLSMETDHVRWLEIIREIGDLMFGKGFKILPKIKPTEAGALKTRMNLPHAGGILRNLSDEDRETWFADAAMVRKNLAPLDTARMLTDLFYGQKMPFSVVQLPEIPNSTGSTDEYWLGAAYPETWKPDGDKLSLVIFGYDRLNDPGFALVIDEWTEIIPSKNQTTGVALHYNQPDSRPPQALMLAVSPDITGSWSLDDLGLIVEESYNLARIRAVEPDHFDETLLAQVLPATTLLSGGEETTVRFMLDVASEAVLPGKDLKGVLADFSSVNSNSERQIISKNE